MKYVFMCAVLALSMVSVNAQNDKDKKSVESKQPLGVVEVKDNSTELALNAIKAHGGDKFKQMNTLVLKGPVDITTSTFSQTIAAQFNIAYEGEKYRIELQNPFQPFKQVFDGQNTFSSIPQFSFPPLNRIGIALLQRVGKEGFKVTQLAEDKKKKSGFRVTSPEGYYTDFFVDEKTGQLKGYEATYAVNDTNVTTSVVIDKMRDVEGVLLPEKFAQRFELGAMTIYADFKCKDILINSKLDEDVFTLPKK
ncbi:MAG: hypothetical protein MUC29_08845 [Pyrinomonadaceae bacterium]|jgi:hypothetical protein|nr:hypothetical protein [Pyrinomonadaceae bacterium]